MKIACYTDIHNQQVMLNYPTILRKSAVIAAENTVKEFGKMDLSIIGGDNISDYPYCNKSCALPFKNWLDIKKKLTENFEKTAKDGKVLYVNGNNDLMHGDLPTKDNPPYNTCEFYHSGPMKKMLGELSYDDYYGIYAKSKGKQAGLYHLAFHYVVDGIDFFGLNIDPDTAFNTHDGIYNKDSLIWLKKKLDEIDPEGNKIIFVVGHLSYYYRKNGEIENSCGSEQETENVLKTFSGHANLFYLYGHVHGQTCVYTDSASGVIHIGKDLKPITYELRPDKETLKKSDFHLVHMGGLRPFQTATKFEFFEDDGLVGSIPGESESKFYEATGTPKIGQYLIIEANEKFIEFNYRNTGSLQGYTTNDKPKKYILENYK